MTIKNRVEKLEKRTQKRRQPVDHAAVHAEIGASIMHKLKLALAGELPPTPPPALSRDVVDTAVQLKARLADMGARLLERKNGRVADTAVES